jgi:hypothetical protein
MVEILVEYSSKIAWRAKMDFLKTILNGVSLSQLGRITFVETFVEQIWKKL